MQTLAQFVWLINIMSNTTLKVSVALCTYNGERFILQQLESMLKQTLPPDEIIICDDGSSDSTNSIISQVQEGCNTPVIHQINKRRLGYSLNFQSAIRKCSGNLIFLSDQDDIWLPQKIQEIHRIMLGEPKLLGLTHEAKLVDAYGNWHGTYKNDQIRRGYGINKKAITGALSCIRSAAVDLLFPLPNGVAYDIWMDYFFSRIPELWRHSDNCLSMVRRHGHNTSTWSVNSLKPISRVTVLKEQFAVLPAVNYDDRLAINKIMHDRLDILKLKGLVPINRIDELFDYLRAERQAIDFRNELTQEQNTLKRKFISIEMLRKGHYKHFNGIKSLVRDLFR